MGSAIRKIIFDTIHKPYFEKILEESLNSAFNKWFTVYDVEAYDKYFTFRIKNENGVQQENINKKLHSFFEGLDPIRIPNFRGGSDYKVYWEDLLMDNDGKNRLNKKYRDNMQTIKMNVKSIERNLQNIKNLSENW